VRSTAADRLDSTVVQEKQSTEMKSLFLTNEFPPNIYGGAGVHVDYLSRELAKLIEVEVRCFGSNPEPKLLQTGSLTASAFGADTSAYAAPKQLHSVFAALQRCLDWNAAGVDADLVHLHTWYTHLGGIFAKLNYGIPLVLTVHSLEPLRPWKREQLGRGYDFSSWVEKTAIEMADAVVAVSSDTREDVLRLFDVSPEKVHVIHNGIDLDEYQSVPSKNALLRHGIDPGRPYLLFVGRITRQKGIIHLAHAIRHMDRDFQVVLCAGAPDTKEIALEMQAAVSEAQGLHGSVIWIQEMVGKKEIIELYSHAAVFCCPSVYEPFGIINLEAMACDTPVVASAVGGIKEVVVNEETGILVPLELRVGTFEPIDIEVFEKGLADAVNRLMADPELRRRMGKAGRARAEAHFSWEAIAQRTLDLYGSLLGRVAGV
jgi:starch synthase